MKSVHEIVPPALHVRVLQVASFVRMPVTAVSRSWKLSCIAAPIFDIAWYRHTWPHASNVNVTTEAGNLMRLMITRPMNFSHFGCDNPLTLVYCTQTERVYKNTTPVRGCMALSSTRVVGGFINAHCDSPFP